jgi:hypothetical protein
MGKHGNKHQVNLHSQKIAKMDFSKCYNLSKRNVKLILKILSDLEPLRGNWAFFGTRGQRGKRAF